MGPPRGGSLWLWSLQMPGHCLLVSDQTRGVSSPGPSDKPPRRLVLRNAYANACKESRLAPGWVNQGRYTDKCIIHQRISLQRSLLGLVEMRHGLSKAGCFLTMTAFNNDPVSTLIGLPRWWQWHPTPVLLPVKSQGRRNLVGCSPWGC